MYRTPQALKQTYSQFTTGIRHYSYGDAFHVFLRNSYPCTRTTKLNNGLSVATEERPDSASVCVGIYIDGGSRYESNFQNGIAHFFEHVVFTGTKNRSKLVLQSDMDSLGATFKSYTTREMACYYVQCMNSDVARATDILTDCVFNNVLSSSDIEAQKRVAYAEMLKHDRDTNKVLRDYLHAAAFQGTPLGNSVMGPSCNLYNFTDETLRTFMFKFFIPARTALVAVGGVSHDQMLCLANCYLSHLVGALSIESDPYRYTGSDVRYRDDSMPMANVALAVEGPSFWHDDNIVMEIGRHAVGSWDRSQPSKELLDGSLGRDASTINNCDGFRSFNISYKDTGLWGCQFLSDADGLDNMCSCVQEEWMSTCVTITESEVERARNIYITKFLSKRQRTDKTCHEIARWILYNGKHPTLSDQISAIERVRAKDVREVCSRYIYNKCLTVAAVGACEGLLLYNRLRGNMYWLRF